MSRTIWKYQLQLADVQELDLPEGAKVLTIQMQHGTPTLWALVDPARRPIGRRLQIVGTGWTVVEPLGRYVGTWQDDGFVWHLFDDATQSGAGSLRLLLDDLEKEIGPVDEGLLEEARQWFRGDDGG